MSEHEASDPIKLPVRYEGNGGGAYIVDADGQDLDDIDWSDEERRTVGQHIATCINERPQLLAETLRLREEVERLRGQLPDGMEECTIQFESCERGHGWLTATNWVQHGCPTCEREDLKRQYKELAMHHNERCVCLMIM